MNRGNGRILCTHVGSLIRPPELVACLRAIDNDEALVHLFLRSPMISKAYFNS